MRIARIDHAAGVDRGRQRAAQLVVRQEEEVVDVQPSAGEAAGELAHQVADVARHLGAQPLRAVGVVLDELRALERDRAVLLLDGDQPAHPVRHQEVDLAVDRGALVGARPVRAVIDRVLVGQFALQALERLEFARRAAAAGGGVGFFGEDACHRRAGFHRGRCPEYP